MEILSPDSRNKNKEQPDSGTLAEGSACFMSVIFGAMIALSFVYAACAGTMDALSESVMSSASSAVELLLTLCGMICMWSGFMEIARRAGLTEKLSRFLSPLLSRLFPDIPRECEAFSYMTMNISANLLGLGNAATPLGLEAMRRLRALSDSDTASDSMVTFVVMNTASIQLLPTTVAALRHSYGARQPFDIILCVWVCSAAALAVGLISSAILRRRSCSTLSR